MLIKFNLITLISIYSLITSIRPNIPALLLNIYQKKILGFIDNKVIVYSGSNGYL